MGAMSPTFSVLGSLKRQRESKIVNFLRDFIQSIENEGDNLTEIFKNLFLSFECYLKNFLFSPIMIYIKSVCILSSLTTLYYSYCNRR